MGSGGHGHPSGRKGRQFQRHSMPRENTACLRNCRSFAPPGEQVKGWGRRTHGQAESRAQGPGGRGGRKRRERSETHAVQKATGEREELERGNASREGTLPWGPGGREGEDRGFSGREKKVNAIKRMISLPEETNLRAKRCPNGADACI